VLLLHTLRTPIFLSHFRTSTTNILPEDIFEREKERKREREREVIDPRQSSVAQEAILPKEHAGVHD
jgi:hypothetical protein